MAGEPYAVDERGVVVKDWGGRFPVALGYPNTYSVGMSNLGFQSVYQLLNRDSCIVAERFFLDGEVAGGRLRTIESRRPVNAAGLIVFSVSFEYDYVNLAAMLIRAGLEPLAADRNENDPPVLVGGVVSFINPRPLFPLVDGFLTGEAEAQAAVLGDVLARNSGVDRDRLLAELASVPGFFSPAKPETGRVVPPRARVDDFVPVNFITSPRSRVFPGTLLVEVNRGCPRGCRFCAAGFVYRPFRNRRLEVLQAAIRRGIGQSGFHRVGLVGSALGDFPELKSLCAWLVAEGLEFAFSSLRVDVLDEELLELLREGGVRTITIAPEAGSERLRRVLRKNLDEELILERAALVAAAGIGHLKLYFLFGLPGETMADIEAIVELVKEIRRVMLEARCRPQLNISLSVSLNPFIPKPHTPLQWAPFAELDELKRKEAFLTRELRRCGGVEIECENRFQAAWQALLSRGGEELAPAIMELAAETGGRARRIRALVREHREKLKARDLTSELPWAFIEQATPVDFLRREYRAALVQPRKATKESRKFC